MSRGEKSVSSDLERIWHISLLIESCVLLQTFLGEIQSQTNDYREGRGDANNVEAVVRGEMMRGHVCRTSVFSSLLRKPILLQDTSPEESDHVGYPNE